MKAHLKYLKYLLIHKWYVYKYGRVLNVPFWRLIVHDWTKFTSAEWNSYVAFQSWITAKKEEEPYYKYLRGDNPAFEIAWTHHWSHNPHHPEYWNYTEVMPETYVREMVADWFGASKAQNTSFNRGWYDANKYKLPLHDDNRKQVELLLDELEIKGFL